MSFLKKFKNRRLQIYLGIAIIICICLGVLSFIDKKKNVSDIQENITETYTIPESEKIFINGSVVPKQSKDFDVPAGAELSSVSVQDGQEVSKGALLFTSKNESIVTQIDGLKSQVEQLKKQKKSLPNTPENSVTIKSLDSDISRLNKEMSSLNSKAYIKTTAPFDGKVYINDAESQTQDLEQPVSASFMSLESTELFMKGQTSEQDFPKLQVDQTVDILVFSTNETLSGRISAISDRPSTSAGGVNSQQGSSSLSYYDVNIQFDSQEKLVNGFHLQASIKVENSSFKIPASAVQEDKKGNKYVFKDIDGILKKQIVDVSTQTEDSAVVRSGLQENDIIIKFPTEDMKEGNPVPGLDGASGNTKDDGEIDNPFEDQPVPDSEEDSQTVG
ncbi:MAG: efflux RND transporter periplasmic adaptor subunit [Clostridioides difficile]|nr:efflux RND transporter periplasmic adaptor subunit [Clostridioides sp.]MBS5788281.1 efflux RND transporter periplasmic adaptor subunit [Clostridioides difficile]